MEQVPVRNIVLQDTGGGCMVETAIHKRTGWLIGLTSECLCIYLNEEEFYMGEAVATIEAEGARYHRTYLGVSSPEGKCGAEILEGICKDICDWWAYCDGGDPNAMRFAYMWSEDKGTNDFMDQD